MHSLLDHRACTTKVTPLFCTQRGRHLAAVYPCVTPARQSQSQQNSGHAGTECVATQGSYLHHSRIAASASGDESRRGSCKLRLDRVVLPSHGSCQPTTRGTQHPLLTVAVREQLASQVNGCRYRSSLIPDSSSGWNWPTDSRRIMSLEIGRLSC